jgi:anaerobic ribonucleoside-triphosphate reductase
MDNDQNWWRQLVALALVSASRAVVEFLTNPSSRDEATSQLRSAFAEIDYDALANALTRAIDEAASTSKGRLNEAIDQLRDRAEDAVDEAKTRAEKQLGQKRSRRGRKFLLGLIVGGLLAYFLLDEQRRDELLDRLTGASGPIEASTQSWAQGSTNTAPQAGNPSSGTTETTEGQSQQNPEVTT